MRKQLEVSKLIKLIEKYEKKRTNIKKKREKFK